MTRSSGRPDSERRSGGPRDRAGDRSGGAGVLRGGLGRAGFLLGAGIGAAATVIGRRAEKSARRGPIDWDAAERIAGSNLRRAPGRRPGSAGASEPL